MDDCPCCWHLHEGLTEYYWNKVKIDKASRLAREGPREALRARQKVIPLIRICPREARRKKAATLRRLLRCREGLKRIADADTEIDRNTMAEAWSR